MARNSQVDTGWTSPDTRIYYTKKYRQVLASAPACAMAVMAGAPLENLKVRMQSRDFASGWQAAKFTYRAEGIRGFWAGTFTPLVSMTMSRALGFSIYRKAKYTFDGWIEAATGRSPLQHVNKPGTYPDLYTMTCFTGAGAVSGAVCAVTLTPVELIKNATQSSVLMASAQAGHASPATATATPSKNAGRVSSWQATKRIVASRGLVGLWIGFRLHIIRDTIGSGIYFGVYETTKQSLNSYYGAETANSAGAIAMAGAICGVGAWVFTYPLDTMKTREQNNLVGITSATPKPTLSSAIGNVAAKTATAASSASKWKGVEMIILRSVLQNMIQMSFFEQAKVWIDQLEFSDGSRTLPEVERQFGRDSIIVNREGVAKSDKV